MRMNRAIVAFWEECVYGDVPVQNAVNAIDDIFRAKNTLGVCSMLWEARKAGAALLALQKA